MQALFDVLNALSTIFSFKLNVVFNCHFFFINKFANCFSNFFSTLSSIFKSCSQLFLSLFNCFLFYSELLLFRHSILVQIRINLIELLIKKNIKPFFSLINDTIKPILKLTHFVFVILQLTVLSIFNLNINIIYFFLKTMGSFIEIIRWFIIHSVKSFWSPSCSLWWVSTTKCLEFILIRSIRLSTLNIIKCFCKSLFQWSFCLIHLICHLIFFLKIWIIY